MRDPVAAALAAYARTEPFIRAWVDVSPQPPLSAGDLDGIVFGVKDIIETAGLATEYGSALYKNRKGTCDASIVTRLRRLGGVMFGKTQTTAFAWFDPAPTRNPRNPAHTPGGSSSGSAAAVAAGVVPMALGTQTMGSIIRPASFCGVTGFKPTFGALPTDGVLPFAPSLDTAGLLTESAAICVRVWSALGLTTQVDTPLKFAVPAGLPSVSPEMDRALDDAVRRLRTVWAVETIDLPEAYARILSAARMVNDFEGARSHHERWREFGDRIGEKLAALVARGIQIPEEHYREKLHYIRAARRAVSKIFEEFPVLLTPAAPGAAPEGLATTGDPVMNAVWTALGTPAVTVPMPLTSGLPLGLQLIAAPHSDFMLLKAASAVEELFARA